MTRDELIEQNLGLVHSCAKRFFGAEYDDLVSAGTLGLIKAADRFDPSRGYQFSTYAVPVILGEMKTLFREGGAVKVSRSLQQLSQKAKRISGEYQKEHGVPITIHTLARLLGVDDDKAAQALEVSSPLSLSQCEQDARAPSKEDALLEHLALSQAIEKLSDEEQTLIRLRYFEHKTQSKTADLLSTTQAQISRREKKILTKLRMMLI